MSKRKPQRLVPKQEAQRQGGVIFTTFDPPPKPGVFTISRVSPPPPAQPTAGLPACVDCKVFHGGCMGCDSNAGELAERGHRTRQDGSHYCGGYARGQRDLAEPDSAPPCPDEARKDVRAATFAVVNQEPATWDLAKTGTTPCPDEAAAHIAGLR